MHVLPRIQYSAVAPGIGKRHRRKASASRPVPNRFQLHRYLLRWCGHQPPLARGHADLTANRRNRRGTAALFRCTDQEHGMRGADTVNDEFEVGFNQTFESRWYRAEQVGRVFMVIVVICALLGLLGRGPYSHQTRTAPGGMLSVDFEPISRRATATMITVHVKHPSETFRLLVDQGMIEPIGYQHTMPRPDDVTLSKDGNWLTFDTEPGQQEVLVRLNVSPTFVGFVPMHISDGTESIDWTIFVVP
jgi:hypothetical protein